MIKFKSKGKNIINLTLPPDVRPHTKHFHKPHITDESVRKWNIGTVDVQDRNKRDRKQ